LLGGVNSVCMYTWVCAVWQHIQWLSIGLVIGLIPKWGPGVLVSTGEAAHPVVTSKGTSKLSQLSMSHLLGEGPCGGAHIPSAKHGTTSY